jgi:hypothetical protein
VVVSCEHGNEDMGSIRGAEFLVEGPYAIELVS